VAISLLYVSLGFLIIFSRTLLNSALQTVQPIIQQLLPTYNTF